MCPPLFFCKLLHISKFFRTFAPDFKKHTIMKHKSILFALLALSFIACNQNEPYQPTTDPRDGGGSSGGGTGGGTQTQVYIDFGYARNSPVIVSFTNRSTGCDSYKWDFGDGTWANGKDATHAYEKLGTYTVTLTGTKGSQKYDKTATIKLTEPTIYFAGYTLYSIPYENKYYRLVVKDDALLPSSWDWNTVYTPLLDNSDMPYTKIFNNPVAIDKPYNHDYWTIKLERNNSASGSGTSCMTAKLKLSELKQYQEEYIFRSESGNTAIGVIMAYVY